MNRFEAAIGLLAVMGTVLVIAWIGLGEPGRMAADGRERQSRQVELGAELFDRQCAICHGANAVGGSGPPLDASSGLYGGDLGPGVAWRLEELGWAVGQPYGYVASVIAAGRPVSTRPDVYPGARTAGAPHAMAMSAWSADFGGPLRPDQLGDLASYLVSFRSAMADDATARPSSAPPTPTRAPTAGTTVPSAQATPTP